MKLRFYPLIPLALVSLTALRGTPTCYADWHPGDSCKMHYPQLPNPNGWDVNVTSYTLADDWQCTQSGPVTGIHFWVSWMQNEVGTITNVHLSIHKDDRITMPFSQPGELLWQADSTNTGFLFEHVLYGSDLQGWADPGQSTWNPGDHNLYFQINCHDFDLPFVQSVDSIYWLDVRITVQNPVTWIGWKTSLNSFEDAAVWSSSGEDGWTPVLYGGGITQNLAFVIDGGEPAPPPTPPAERGSPKWLRPLDTNCAIDKVSIGAWTGQQWQDVALIADDFISDGRPITTIGWWGSYGGYETGIPGAVPPPATSAPTAYRLRWYEDIQAGIQAPYSMPGKVLADETYPTGFGGVVEQHVATVTNTTGSGWNHEFYYYVNLTNGPWLEKEGNIYWLSVQALCTGEMAHAWGWATTPVLYNWNDDAAQTNSSPPGLGWQELHYAPDHPYSNQSINMAFKLNTDITPRRAKKWRQPPDMDMGENMPSFRTNGIGILRAEDFVSDGRRITDIHWWGSYLDYEKTCSNQVASPPDPTRPPGFDLSWHADIPDPDGPGPDFSRPGITLTNLFVPIDQCHEVYYGTVNQHWKTPTQYEHEFQYYVDLLSTNIDHAAPWYELNGTTYWLNIQAVWPVPWEEGVHNGWGWKTTYPTNRWNDASVWKTTEVDWQSGTYPTDPPPLHPYYNLYTNCDLSFELTTDEVGTNRWVGPITITNINWAGPQWLLMKSVGDVGAGTQYLMGNTNSLLTNTWFVVESNTVPLLPSPYTNPWLTPYIGVSNEFFQIWQY